MEINRMALFGVAQEEYNRVVDLLEAKEYEIKDLKKEHREDVKSTKAKVKELKKTLDRKAEETEDKEHSNAREVARQLQKKDDELERKEAVIQKLTKAKEALEADQADSLDIDTRTLALEKKEKLFEAKEAAMDTLKAEFKKLKDESEAKAEEKYTAGYADGLSDGVRKGIDASAEDRKQANSVALMAAASHTPLAAERIAENMGHALPATASSSNK
jgi:DNA repair exonuclease SbcCD ATPase subunit